MKFKRKQVWEVSFWPKALKWARITKYGSLDFYVVELMVSAIRCDSSHIVQETVKTETLKQAKAVVKEWSKRYEL